MSSKSVYQSWKHTDLISELPRYEASRELTPHSFRTSDDDEESSSSSSYHYSMDDHELFMDDDDSMYATALMNSGLYSQQTTATTSIFDSPDNNIPNGRLKMLLAHIMDHSNKNDTKGKGKA
jgi:hypothetical protein